VYIFESIINFKYNQFKV